MRKLSKEERAGLKWWTQKYVDNGAYCLKHGISVGGPLQVNLASMPLENSWRRV